MTGVAVGFAIIGTIVLIGIVAGRLRVGGDHAGVVLNRLAFSIFTPCLMFTVLSHADIHRLISGPLLVVVVASSVIFACYGIVSRFIWRRPLANTVVGMLSSGYVNANNIGLPVATYVLGDPSLVAPVLLYQLLIVSPTALTVLDVQNGRESGLRLWRLLLQPFANPLIVACALGLLVSLTGLEIPEIAYEPFRLVGAAAVPAVLLSFGISLTRTRVFAAGSERRAIVLASALKLFAMPLIAWAFGYYVMRLDAEHLYSVVVLTALPTAQNVYTYSQRYGQGMTIARDTALITSIGALPVLLALAAILHPS